MHQLFDQIASVRVLQKKTGKAGLETEKHLARYSELAEWMRKSFAIVLWARGVLLVAQMLLKTSVNCFHSSTPDLSHCSSHKAKIRFLPPLRFTRLSSLKRLCASTKSPWNKKTHPRCWRLPHPPMDLLDLMELQGSGPFATKQT